MNRIDRMIDGLRNDTLSHGDDLEVADELVTLRARLDLVMRVVRALLSTSGVTEDKPENNYEVWAVRRSVIAELKALDAGTTPAGEDARLGLPAQSAGNVGRDGADLTDGSVRS